MPRNLIPHRDLIREKMTEGGYEALCEFTSLHVAYVAIREDGKEAHVEYGGPNWETTAMRLAEELAKEREE